jgi:uncharacterized protein YecE (DUF72 family)
MAVTARTGTSVSAALPSVSNNFYAEAELAPWAERLKSLTDVRRASVIFNNCYSNFSVMNAATMAQMLKH